MCVQNLKFVALPVPQIIGGTQKNLGSPCIRPRSIFSQIFNRLLFAWRYLPNLTFVALRWKRLMIQHGNTESWKISLMLGSVDAYQCSFRASFRIDNFKSDWALTCPTSSNRKWEFHRAASYQSLSLHSKSTLIVKSLTWCWVLPIVDDFVICYRSKFVHIIERHLQRSLNKLQHWVDSNGFKFSATKTVSVHFCRLRKAHPDLHLLLNGIPWFNYGRPPASRLTVDVSNFLSSYFFSPPNLRGLWADRHQTLPHVWWWL